MSEKDPAEKAIRDIRRKTRRHYLSEEKIRIVLEGLRGEENPMRSLRGARGLRRRREPTEKHLQQPRST